MHDDSLWVFDWCLAGTMGQSLLKVLLEVGVDESRKLVQVSLDCEGAAGKHGVAVREQNNLSGQQFCEVCLLRYNEEHDIPCCIKLLATVGLEREKVSSGIY